MGSSKSSRKKKRLSAGRPPGAQKPKAALTAAATRTLIRTHHQLHKELSKARSAGDVKRVEQLEQQIEAAGGLESYQQASILGQSKDRGGDSSLVLMEWLKPAMAHLKQKPKVRMLEVGALSTENACSRAGVFDIERIDLNSQGPGILKQDLMQRKLPSTLAERFCIVSLSLVLNYVPEAVQRGEMLRRTALFLRDVDDVSGHSIWPALFLVLPLPCVDNSRYMSKELLTSIMTSLGYQQLHEKRTSKLYYSLWRLVGRDEFAVVPKREVNSGSNRNNFSITLRGG